ncbi:MAG TPA: glycosyltransferase [Vicinamibacteria bacterium]
MSAPAVSVCVPTWNGSAYVADALRSALAQTFHDFELLVVDDASTDDTLRVVASFDDPRVRVHRNERRLGLPGNWNRCLELARGEYVKFLFQDDLLEPDAVGQLLEALRRTPEAGLAFGRRIIRHEGDGAGTPLLLGDAYPEMQRRFYGSLRGGVRGEDLVRSALREGRDLTVNVLGEPSFVLLRRHAVMRAGGFDPGYRQLVDWDLWLRLGRGAVLVFVDETLGVFRVHDGGQSVRNRGSLRVPWEYVRLLTRIQRQYGPALGRAERRRLGTARWRCRRHLAGEALRLIGRRAMAARGAGHP